MTERQIVSCRRCGRPLRSRWGVAAQLGARCALIEAVEAAEGAPAAPQAVVVPHAAAAVALVASFLGREPQAVHDQVLTGANPYDVASLLAAGIARTLNAMPGGAEWLHRLGLAAAEQEAGGA